MTSRIQLNKHFVLLPGLMLIVLFMASQTLRPAEASESLPALVTLQVPVSETYPPTLHESLVDGDLAELARLVDVARAELLQPGEDNSFESRDAFEIRYERTPVSALDKVLQQPHVVQVNHLLRSKQLNPFDQQFSLDAIAKLEKLVHANRKLISETIGVREFESHHLSLRVARDSGVMPVEPLLKLVPYEEELRIADAARKMDPSEGRQFARVQLASRAAHVQEILGADLVLLHGSAAFLVPNDTVLPLLAHYQEFIDGQAIRLAYDVLSFFSEHGALVGEPLEELVASLDRIALGGLRIAAN